MNGKKTQNHLELVPAESKEITVDPSIYEKDEQGEVKTDDTGRPVFKDRIEMETNTAEHRALWTCIKAVLENGVVPEPELDAVFILMENLASQERDSRKPYKITLDINYFVGLWHCVNTSRKFDLFNEDKKMSEAVDGLALKLAGYLDAYHKVKNFEKTVEEASPKDILSLPNSNSTT